MFDRFFSFFVAFVVLGFVPSVWAANKNAPLEIKSPAFAEGEWIPKQYTCDGENISPPLEWFSVPRGTQSLALIFDDPDAPAGTWVHWVVYDIAPVVKNLDENQRPEPILGNNAKQGMTDFRKIGYGGPCPPRGSHRYFFRLYALDSKIDLKPGATKQELLSAMKGHVLTEATLMGKYQR